MAAKLALCEALLATSVSRSELGRRLGVSEAAVRRLLDLDHSSQIEKVTQALQLLGRAVTPRVETVENAA